MQLWHGLADAALPSAHGRWLAGRIPGIDAHFPADDDHATIEAAHRGEAYGWLLAQAGRERLS